MMMKWIRTSRLPIKDSLSVDRSDLELLVVLATIPPLSPDRPLSPGFPPLSVSIPRGRDTPTLCLRALVCLVDERISKL
jgi:hypothetical protein